MIALAQTRRSRVAAPVRARCGKTRRDFGWAVYYGRSLTRSRRGRRKCGFHATSVANLSRTCASQMDRQTLVLPGVELTVVIPTRNERDNIVPLCDRLRVALGAVDWEVIFVDDDSSDGTR